MRAMNSFRVAFLLFLVAVPGFADGEREFLLPISGNNLPGGHGTFWTASLTVLNDGEEIALVTVDRTCSFPNACPDGLSLMPGEWHSTGLEGLGRGNLVTVERGNPQFSYRLYVSDSFAGDRKVLTELPIVPVDSLCNEPLRLFQINLPAGTRHALRIYDASEVEKPAVRVTARYRFANAILFDRVVELEGRRELRPAEAALFDFLPIPDIEILLTIEPLDPEMRIWAFLSVTDNLTHDLVLYTPQTPPVGCSSFASEEEG